MGKTPVFGVVSFCWLGLALTGCDTCNTSNTVPKDRYQARTTFGTPNKDAAVAKNATPDATAKNKPTGLAPVEETAAKLPDNGAAGRGTLPDTVGDRYNNLPRGGSRTPGEAGLVDAPPPGLKKTIVNPADKSVMPVGGTDDGAMSRSTLRTSNAPQMSTAGEPMLPPGSTGVALPPPPGSSGPSNGTPLPPLSPDAVGNHRSSLHPIAPAAPTPDSLVPPPPPVLKPAEARAPIYDVPPPPPPAPPAAKMGEPSTANFDTPPAPPAMPFIPGGPK